MATEPTLENFIRDRRTAVGWSQEELARRSGLSRTGVGAIEAGRLVPSTASALALSSAFGCRVEDLFRLPGGDAGHAATWAWLPDRFPARFWRAEVGGRARLYPVESTLQGTIPHDGVSTGGESEGLASSRSPDTLIVACCDPAIGLLASELARATGIRLVALPRSSRSALELLGRGLVHASGVHLGRSGEAGGNAAVIEKSIGPGFRLLQVARWEEGIASKPGIRLGSASQAIGMRWIGREAGSGARRCLDEVLEGRPGPRRTALDHRGVAEAIRSGSAEVGICLRLVVEEAGLEFFGIAHEEFDFCFSESTTDDRRIRALIEVVRSSNYRRLLDELPGYDSSRAGVVG